MSRQLPLRSFRNSQILNIEQTTLLKNTDLNKFAYLKRTSQCTTCREPPMSGCLGEKRSFQTDIRVEPIEGGNYFG